MLRLAVLGLLAATAPTTACRRTDPPSAQTDGPLSVRAAAPDLDRRLAQFKAVQMPFNAAGLSDARAPDGRPARRRLPAAREHVLAAERSGRTRAVQGASRSRHAARAQVRQLPADQRQPLGPARREPAVRRLRADAAGTRALSARISRARRCEAVRHAASGRRRLQIYNAVHGRAIGRARTWPARRITSSTSSSSSRAAKALRDAAALSDDPAFAKFLRLRADALLSDDYYASDLAWLDLKDPKFDVIFAPYETYLDDLLGVKTSYGAAVLIRNEEESRKPGRSTSNMCRIFRTRCRWRPPTVRRSAATLTPMEVMDAPFRARRPAARLPGGRRQPAQRSAHPRGEGHEEDLLQELHGRAGELRDPAAGEAR